MTKPALITVRVAARRIEALDIVSLDLVPEDGSALPAFAAGAHIDVHLPGGLVRPYSLCNPPGEEGCYQIAVLRDPASRGGSQAVHAHLEVGTALAISPPRNHFPLDVQAPFHLLLAGGIGITPLWAMAQALSQTGQPFELHFCTRSRARTPFLDTLASSPFAAQVQHHYDDGEPSQKLDIAATIRQAPAGTHLYVCGPQGFIDAVLQAGRDAGWPENRLHREYFGAAPAASANQGAFELQLASSGRVIPVQAHQSALAALLASGLDIPMSCEQGVCGTCLTGVRAGTPDHRDQYLTDEERAANDRFLPCCSRALSPRLVLEL